MKRKIAIIVSRFNQSITQKLLEGALQTFEQSKIAKDQIQIFWVPGAFEIPFVCQKLCDSKKFAAVIALGCILKGETSHNHYIAQAVVEGLLEVSLRSNVPVAFGVLTPNTRAQALARAGRGSSNKGKEAAEAAIEILRLLKTL